MRLLAPFVCLLLLLHCVGCDSSASQRRQLQAQHSHTTEEALHSEDAEGADSKHKEPKETIAEVLEEALKHEFHAEEEKKVLDEGKKFNETAKSAEAKPETVLIIHAEKPKDKVGNQVNRTAEGEQAAGSAADKAKGSGPKVAIKDGKFTPVASASTEDGEQAEGEAAEEKKPEIELNVETDVDRIIDSHDNEYVLSKPNEEGSMGLNLDPQFVRDLSILIAASALGGLVMEALGQPTINGYFIAGSAVGPGGLKLVKELVQVQSMAQLGVHLLLFSLGLEFSLSKLKAMRNVAMLGGLLEIVLMSALGGVGALFIGASAYQGAFLGALVAMSSTSIVVKCLNDRRVQNQLPSQITIATLVLQDLVVGLLFAFMPVIASAAGGEQISAMALGRVMGHMLLMLGATVITAVLVARTILPRLARLLEKHTSSETYQLVLVAFCLMTALATIKLGVSAELGAFIAGVMCGSTDQQESMVHHLEAVTHFFVALFIASIGLILSPIFLLNHLLVLGAGLSVIVIAKTALVGGVVWLFRYPADTALAVGINLAQVGEFAFILLSVANQYALLPSQVYMLMMGVTALSLLITPFLLQVSMRLLPRVRSSGALGGSAQHLELAALKRQQSGLSSGGWRSAPQSPHWGGGAMESGGAPGFKLQSQTGQELGHRHVRGAQTMPLVPVVTLRDVNGTGSLARHSTEPSPLARTISSTSSHM